MERRFAQFFSALVLLFALERPALAGFPSTETYLPAVGRVRGQGGAQFYTTVWATNLTRRGRLFHVRVPEAGTGQRDARVVFRHAARPARRKSTRTSSSRSSASPASSAPHVSRPPARSSSPSGSTTRLRGTISAKRKDSFSPESRRAFSISPGQSASIQGINQGGSENFRYNFALVETGGGSPTVNVQVFDGSGTLLGQKAYALQPYEQIQPKVDDVVAGIRTINARITATVTGGTGSVLLAGAQLANLSQDSSGFEMSFRDSLLGRRTPASRA